MIVTFHTFPSDSLDKRIPPTAQIERWKKQLNGKESEITPYTRCGFGGFRIVCFEEKGMIGYAMQLTPPLFQAMLYPHSKLEDVYFTEMRSDYTVKAVGSGKALENEAVNIDSFVKSLKWIYPLRSPF